MGQIGLVEINREAGFNDHPTPVVKNPKKSEKWDKNRLVEIDWEAGYL